MSLRRPVLEGAFDRSGRLRAPPASRLAREAWALAFNSPPQPDPASLPDGGGRAVLVVPAFLTGDNFSAGLRRYLDRCGFRSHAAEIGLNWGPTARILGALEARCREIRRNAGGPVALVGISMGGLLARNLAYEMPDDIAHVVTIASPIRLPTATLLEPLIRLCARAYSQDLDLARLAQPMPVPWTSIYSREDGLVAWESCVGDGEGGVSIEVRGPHLILAGEAEALRVIVTRLAPREGG